MEMRRRELLKAALAGAGSLAGRAHAQEDRTAIYLHPAGSDANPGSRDRPLKTLARAARLVNAATGNEAIDIVLSEGVYALDEPALFQPARRSFTKTARLTVRAEVLPDDDGWTPRSMPVLIHTMPLSPNWMGRPDPFGGVAYGMQFETSHVTVRGLRILGSPYVESPGLKMIRRVYPIAREGAALDDLEIQQCLFAGNRETVEMHCAVLARGHGVVVDHCVFYGCKITVVYWTGQARGCAMRHTLVHGSYVTGAWLCAIADDFDFRGNVVSSCHSAVLFQGPVGKYNLASSLLAGNRHLYGTGFGPAVNFRPLPPSTIALPASSQVSNEPVEIELDQTKRNYMHVVSGAPGSEIGAGLFLRRS
jgi:hypothetical protein